MKKYFTFSTFLPLLVLFSFQVQLTADEIINNTIEKHGGQRFLNVRIDFDFRDKHYRSQRTEDGLYKYERIFEKDEMSYRDVLNNNGLMRYVNGKRMELPDERSAAYARSINSVIYFALLPYGLNDAAVHKILEGTVEMKGEPYYRIRVYFDQQGGGEDHDDVFIYWVHQENFTVDYLAYSYHTDGGGLRFRSYFNRRKVSGIIFQDYVNYQPDNASAGLDDLEALFLADKLKELSRIELENIVVKKIKPGKIN